MVVLCPFHFGGKLHERDRTRDVREGEAKDGLIILSGGGEMSPVSFKFVPPSSFARARIHK